MLIGHAQQAAASAPPSCRAARTTPGVLAGPPGVGKATFAADAATWALATAAGPPVGEDSFDVPSTHPIAGLVEAGSHMDLRSLRRTADDKGKLRTVIRVEEVRQLQPLFRNPPRRSATGVSSSSIRRTR